MLTTIPLYQNNSLRNAITNAYRMDEAICINQLLQALSFADYDQVRIHDVACELVTKTRAYRKNQGKLETLLYQYDLSTDEGIALMCLAEALLRIPDKATIDKFISDKISTVNWKNHISHDNTLFVNAATWSLLISGKIYAPAINNEQSFQYSLNRAVSKVGISMIRPIILKMMQAIGNQFVMGESIQEAIKRAKPLEEKSYLFSYDMLGESARTPNDAAHYYAAYQEAIRAVGTECKHKKLIENPGVSIKLSALHPRYEFAQYARLLEELPPLLLSLAKLAKQYNMALVVDAEETDRLDLSLAIFEKVFCDPALNGWDGFGLAIQAYQKRAFYLIDWLQALAKQQQKRMVVRLVKGAYWDAEIKVSQMLGLPGYPVFTRKHGTDVSYLACAKKLLNATEYFYPQFGTHNAFSIAAIMQMAPANSEFEFQCLHGMGRPVYDHMVELANHRPVRVYAPVGTHQDLLGYLVRRLLENGANSSFVNILADDTIPVEKVVTNPVTRMQNLKQKAHKKIPLPQAIFPWENSLGLDLSNQSVLVALQAQLSKLDKDTYLAQPIVNGKAIQHETNEKRYSPIDTQLLIGSVYKAQTSDIEVAINSAYQAKGDWSKTSVDERAKLLERASELLQQALPELLLLLTKEAGRSVADSLAEIREAIDYCRYYAYRARIDFQPQIMPGPTGETNILRLHPRGVMACISPWNFPLAIFMGQIVANLAVGNTVIAKPAEQTPFIACKAIQILHQAGIPKDALHLLIGPGREVGQALTSDPRIAGVIFTGSTKTAQHINQTLANRPGPLGLLVAETGGQNAMIVDSSALLEQTVVDICLSAFNSAGQRCSALRVLFVQEDIADKLISMLTGYMQTMQLGDPRLLQTDVGPVIDAAALNNLQAHIERMHREAKLIATVKQPSGLNGHYLPPHAFELPSLDLITEEVFGPILHVIRFKTQNLENVVRSILATGYGLTMGIQSRITTTVNDLCEKLSIGNIYINRNMIGAQVGAQPFGGERLSGTGPKAGGPNYLPRLCHEQLITNNITAVGGNARLVSLLEDEEC